MREGSGTGELEVLGADAGTRRWAHGMGEARMAQAERNKAGGGGKRLAGQRPRKVQEGCDAVSCCGMNLDEMEADLGSLG